jgi:ADP-ribosyl-[dinitrogen reductase] hydrolase
MSKHAVLVGCAIGDSLGLSFEMKGWSYQPLLDWNGAFTPGGTFWKGQAGQYTDDTMMSLALARSLTRNGKYVPSDVAQGYLEWYLSGNTRGIGATTAQAMHNLKIEIPWDQSGVVGDKVAGNGTAMRVAPLGMAYRHNLIDLIDFAQTDASITHNSPEPKAGSMAIALGTALLSHRNLMPEEVLESVINVIPDSIVKNKLVLCRLHLKEGTDERAALIEIGSAGYVPETVAAAFYCLIAGNNYKEVVIKAVKAGGDTDTTAAIAGAMAGAFYGLDGIPDEYKDGVENFEELCSLDEQLVNIEI